MKSTNRTKFYNFALRRPFNLQRFADEGDAGSDGTLDNGDPNDGAPEDGQADPAEDSKTPKYTEEDMQRALRRKAAEVNKKRDKEEKEKVRLNVCELCPTRKNELMNLRKCRKNLRLSKMRERLVRWLKRQGAY